MSAVVLPSFMGSNVIVAPDETGYDHDELTGLLTRKSFRQLFDDTTPIAGAFLFIDLEKFKRINDNCGHAKGDMFLRKAAKFLRDNLPIQALVGRWGGDEFVAVIPGVRGKTLEYALNQLLSRCQTVHVEHNGDIYTLGINIGISVFDNPSCAFELLLDRADQAMYEAKGQGIGKKYYKSTVDAVEHVQFGSVQEYIKHHQPAMHFQPVISLKDNKVLYWESLLRIKLASGQLISPVGMIAQAERSGDIRFVDVWIFGYLISEINKKEIVTPISINMSPISLLCQTTIEKIISLISGCISPQLITIELTETALIEDFAKAKESLARIRNIGCLLAIDDFGVGYTSFNLLFELPLDFIKIDAKYIDDICGNSKKEAFVKAINDMATTFGYAVIAEGISSGHVLAKCKSMGIAYGQGYLLGMPGAINV